MERNKTKEQLEEEKKISLSFRIKPLAIEGFNESKLREKAQELWELIVKLETEKYDLEERQKRQDYDVSCVKIRVNPAARPFSLFRYFDVRKIYDCICDLWCFASTLQLKELKERQKQQLRHKALKKGLDPEALTGKYPPKIQVASKYERRVDTRSYDDKKKLFEGVSEKKTSSPQLISLS